MTAIKHINRKSTKKFNYKSLLCLLFFGLSIIYGGLLKEGVIYGLKICAFNIIPTLFPFFILSDLWETVFYFDSNSIVAKGFEKIFNINGEGLSCFLIGSICGFPLGAKSLSEKYCDNFFNDEELDSLSAICNNPSAPFVISGIGVGLFGSLKIGIILQISVILSAIFIGWFFRPNHKFSTKQKEKRKQNFNLIKSIQSAGLSSISVASYIIFFSGILGVIKSLIKNEIIISIISAFFEIGSACTIINKSSTALQVFCLPLLSFALGFSGISVFMQVFSILPKIVSKEKYLLKKLLQGIVSSIITFLLIKI